MKVSLREYWALLARYLAPQRRMALLLGVLLALSIGLQLVNPQIVRRFIDTAQAGGATATLLRIALLFIAVALAQQAVAVLATYAGENVGWTATNELRADLAEHCLGLDMGFHNAHTPGEMIERIDGDVTALASFFSQFVIEVAGNALLLVGVLILLAREDWRVGLALTALSALGLATLLRLRNVAVPFWGAERQASAELYGFLGELLGGTEDVRANGARPYAMQRFFRLARELMARALRAGLMVNFLMTTLGLVASLATAAALALGAHLFRAGAMSIGTVYLVFRYTAMLERPLERISRQLQDLQKAGAGIARIRGLLDRQSLVADPPFPLDALPQGALAVAFQGVSFAYHDGPASPPGEAAGGGDEREAVLHGISFHLQPGAVLGLLGRTGSGKTTLTRLLFRLYDPDEGTIALGGGDPGAPPVDIRQLSLLKLRRRIGMVTQQIELFHGTVRDNLTLFDGTIPDDAVWQVIRELGLEGWIGSLPQGLDTVLERGGGGLSAGEAQLLALMRVFLRDPGLVILDEASSRLDPATERLVERAVERLVRGGRRTAIIIAHRLGTVERAGEIMILEDGRICEHGPRAALAADPGSRFHALRRVGLEEVLA